MKNFRTLPDLNERQIMNFHDKIMQLSDEDCWEWTGSKTEQGYGLVNINSQCYLTNRVMYKIHYGVDPGEFDVAHDCNNSSCCNPYHLSLQTHAKNTQDAFRDGLMSDRKGESNNKAKLTDEEVKEIRWLAINGVRTEKIAKQFKISPSQVRSICRGDSWTHIPLKPKPRSFFDDWLKLSMIW